MYPLSGSSRWKCIAYMAFFTWLFLLACGSVHGSYKRANLSVLWSYPTPISEFGFSYSLDRSRLAVDEIMSLEGVTIYSNYIANLSVPNCFDAVSAELLAGLDGSPYDMWIIGGQQYTNCVAKVDSDARFANVSLLHLSGLKPTHTIANSFPAIHEVRFLHGVLCAKATKSNVVGYVTSVPQENAAISRGLSAFVLGVKSVNTNIKVVLGLTGEFLNPVAEEKATDKLIEKGADCIAQHQNGLTVNRVASRRNVFSLGYATDGRYWGDENVLSSLQFHWHPLVLETIRAKLNFTWFRNWTLSEGFSVGAVSLTGYSTKVEGSWRKYVHEIEDEFRNRSRRIFCTPLFDDPQWISDPDQVEHPYPGVTCLKKRAVLDMTGIIRDAEIVVQFNATHSPYVIIWIHWSSPASIALCVLCLLQITLALGTAVDVIWNSRHPVYRASSPLFCLLILTGIILSCIGPFFWIGPRTRVNCMLPYWFIGVGFSLVYSCMLAKNWRIWRIFSSGRFRVVAIMDFQLIMRFVVVIVGLELLLLILWTILDPQLPSLTTSSELSYDEKQASCASKQTIAGLCFFVYLTLLLVPVSVIAYWTRVAKDEYRESRAIASTVFVSFILIVVMGAILFAISDSYRVFFHIAGYFFLALHALVYFNLFVPKLWRIHLAKSSLPAEGSTDLSTINTNRGLESRI